MSYFDLNVPWRDGGAGVEQTVAFLSELGYTTIALNHSITSKLPGEIKCAIPDPLPFAVPRNTKILRRCTLTFSDAAQNYRLNELAAKYDVLALRPTNEKSLAMACTSNDADIISLDMTLRLDFFPRMKILSAAVERGIALELCYGPAVVGDTAARRNAIGNAMSLVRASRGRGLVVSSEATRAAACRAPADVINLAAVWGLGQERGKEALAGLAMRIVANAELRRRSYKGVVDVLDGGIQEEKKDEESKEVKSKKRKAQEVREGVTAMPLSKREQKRRKKVEQETKQNPKK